jgi:predicted negative regulator of RcsB-dependent stress response
MKMNRLWGWLAVAGIVASPVWGAVRTAEQETQVIDRFLQAVQTNQDLPAEQVQKAVDAATALKSEDESRSLAITEGLRELYPAFREALQAMGEEKLEAAQASLSSLTTAPDPYLAAEASYFLARLQLLQERYEEALPLLDTLETKFTDLSLHTGEALFYKGVAQAQMLKRKDAIASLQRYLDENPAAPERMKIGAWRQLEQLKMVEEGTLSDVFSRMDYSRRRLALEDSGNNTQAEQKKVVAILEQLIKEAEERECNGKGSGKGQKKGQKQGKAGEGEGNAQGQGSQGGNTGGGSKGIDSAAMERLHRGGPQSPWSQLRDKDRDPVYNAIKEKFPGRYRQLIEQYYKSFQEEGEEG